MPNSEAVSGNCSPQKVNGNRFVFVSTGAVAPAEPTSKAKDTISDTLVSDWLLIVLLIPPHASASDICVNPKSASLPMPA